MAQGSYQKRGKMWSVVYRDAAGQQRRQSGFTTKAEAQGWMGERHQQQRDGFRMDPKLTFRMLIDLYLDQHSASPARIEKLRYMLAKADMAFGDIPLVDLSPQRIGSWRNTLTEGTRHDALAAVKQALRAAVEWKLIPTSPAQSVSNPAPVREEFDPFDSWDDVRDLENVIREHYQGLATIVTGTGLRPQEWTKLRWEHIDLERRVMNLPIQVVKPKTPARKVPLRGLVVDLLASREQRRGLVFTNDKGNAIDLHHFRRRVWYPAQVEVNRLREVDDLSENPARRPYDMRHTYATWGLRAGMNTFDLARRMGTSLEMIDKTYGHHAPDSDSHELRLLDAFDKPIGNNLVTKLHPIMPVEATDTYSFGPNGRDSDTVSDVYA